MAPNERLGKLPAGAMRREQPREFYVRRSVKFVEIASQQNFGILLQGERLDALIHVGSRIKTRIQLSVGQQSGNSPAADQIHGQEITPGNDFSVGLNPEAMLRIVGSRAGIETEIHHALGRGTVNCREYREDYANGFNGLVHDARGLKLATGSLVPNTAGFWFSMLPVA